MKIEMLYPEVCNLFGDISNIKYLKKCLPDAEIIKTEIIKTGSIHDIKREIEKKLTYFYKNKVKSTIK